MTSKKKETEHPNFEFQVGRKAGSPCGHYYPDFLRNYDDLSVSGKMIERHCYCFKCKREFIIRLHPKHLDMEHLELGDKSTIKQLMILRKKEWRRLSKKYKEVDRR